MTNQPSLAQQAFTTYDTRGEYAMIAFLAKNLQQTEEAAQNAFTQGLFTLADGSRLDAATPGLYTIPQEDGDPPQLTRARTVTLHRPQYLQETNVPMFPHWPGTHAVWCEVMWKAEEEAADRLGVTATNRDRADHPNLSLQESFLAAHGLNNALTEAVKGYDIPDKLLCLLDNEVASTAEQALRDLPDGQFEQLIQAAMKKMDDGSGREKS